MSVKKTRPEYFPIDTFGVLQGKAKVSDGDAFHGAHTRELTYYLCLVETRGHTFFGRMNRDSTGSGRFSRKSLLFE